MRWFIQRHNHKGQKVDTNTNSRQRLSALMRNASAVERTSARATLHDGVDNRINTLFASTRRTIGSAIVLFVVASTITFAPSSVLALSAVDAISGTTVETKTDEVKDLLPNSPLAKDDDDANSDGESQYITPTVTSTSAGGSNTRPSGSTTALPGAISSLVVRPGNGTLDVTWVAPDPGEEGLAAATRYRLRHSLDGSNWTTLTPIEGLSARIAGLTNGVVVFVEVAAMNGSGTGPSTSSSGIPAAPASSPTGPGVPGPATSGDPVGTAIMSDSPSAYWPMGDATGSSVASATVGSTALSGGLSFGFGSPIAGASSAYATGAALPTGVSVGSRFSVSAMIDPAGNGGDNAIIAAAGDRTNGFEFRQADRGALEFVGFSNGRAQRLTTSVGLVSQGAWHQVAVVVDGDDVTIVIDGRAVKSGTIALGGGSLTIGGSEGANSYRGWLSHVAVFGSPLGAHRLAAHWSATGYRAPSGSSPTVRGGDGYLLVSWGAPANDGGSRIIGYRVEVRAPGGEWQTAIANTYSSSTSSMVTTSTNVAITNGVAYDVRVRAVTDVGAGDPTDVVTATPRGSASAPANVVASGSGSGAIALAWETPVNDGGFAISGYDIELSVDDVSWSTVASTSEDTRSISVSSLMGRPLGDTDHRIRVRARTTAGRGIASDAITVNPHRSETGRRATESSTSETSSAAEPTPEFIAESRTIQTVADDASQRRSILAVGGVPGRVGSLVATPTNGGATLGWVAPTDTGTS